MTNNEQVDAVFDELFAHKGLLPETHERIAIAKAQLTALLREARLNELKNLVAHGDVVGAPRTGFRHEIDRRIAELQSGKES